MVFNPTEAILFCQKQMLLPLSRLDLLENLCGDFYVAKERPFGPDRLILRKSLEVAQKGLALSLARFHGRRVSHAPFSSETPHLGVNGKMGDVSPAVRGATLI
jgi:hypothetical protein